MRTTVLWAIAILSHLLLTGCAITPQKATLRPEPKITRADVGRGVSVAVRVVDERPTRALGFRGTGAVTGTDIVTDQDVAEVVHKAVEEGLKDYGFRLIPYSSEAPRSLRIDVRFLEYRTTHSFVTIILNGSAAIRVAATNKGKTYENFYRVHNEKHYLIVPFAEENERVINQALSDVLQRLFDDKTLSAFLAD
jgi:uncharacterized lipoprotein YajG